MNKHSYEISLENKSLNQKKEKRNQKNEAQEHGRWIVGSTREDEDEASFREV